MTDTTTEPEPEMTAKGWQLAGDLLAASMSQNAQTTERLYEIEMEQRKALEVHITQVLQHFEQIALGTVGQYEQAVRHLAALPYGEKQKMLAAEYDEWYR